METDKVKMISVGELFSQTWVIYKNKFWKLMALSFLPILGIIPAVVIAIVWGVMGSAFNASNSAIGLINVVMGLLGIVTFVAIIVISYIAQIGVMVYIKDDSALVSIKEIWKKAKPYAWPYFVLSLLTGILLILWGLLLIIPAIIMGVYYSFVAWVFLNEDLKNMKAIRRSKELVSGYWWPVFWRTLLLCVIMWIIIGLFSGLRAQSSTVNSYSFVSNVISFIISPFYIIYSYKMYQNLVKIKESAKSETNF